MTGRVCVVFGGANGIGRAAAEALAGRGASVVIADRDADAGTALMSRLREQGSTAAFLPVDLLEDASVEEVYRAAESDHGAVHCVVNSAGAVAEGYPGAFERNVDLLLGGVWRSMHHGVDALARAGGGSIVNVSSIAGITGSIGAPGYGPAKHGVVGLTKDFALSAASVGVRVNVVCPGYVLTRLTETWAADPAASEQLINEKLRVPMRRWGRPEEIGAVIAFLASAESSFMTGAVVVVDGGLTAR